MIDISSFISEDRYKVPEGVRDWDGSRITAPEVGFFDGTKEAIKDILPNAALQVGSALTGMFTGSGRQATIEQAAAEAQEQGIPIADSKEFARKQAEYMDASAKELRRIAEEEYTPNPDATGVAGQIIHGVGTELTKAMLVAPIAAASPQAAALAYGALHGVETTQRYKDKGVDENTANWLGVSAFGTGTLGFLIPAAAGPTRLASAVYGAITNPAANVSEDLATRMILRKQNYEALAATINPFDPLNLAVAAFVGGGFGTIGFHKKATVAVKKLEEKTTEAAPEKPQTLADSVVEGAKTTKKAAAEVPDVSQVQEASALRMAENGVVLQNRNRGTASSIVQMQQIAGNPIYNMVSVSREFSSGAPVIAFPNNFSEGQWGRTETVSASDGSQMEMRYAVVEADDLQVSNFADGTRNADYGVVKQNVTIAGNGRVAGISAAYERGTAEKYKADLIKDADNVGIKPSVIEGMKEPVLVRVMSDRDAGRPDIAMLSNQSGTKALDATEQAENDAAAIDVSKLTFDEDGNITDETVKQFAALVPDNSSLVDRNGIPNTLARPRLERAIFQRAYGNANLTSLLTDTESEGGRAVSIFLKLAPKMMQLEGAGDLDFRDALVAALNEVYVARASGSFKSLKELAASQSLGRMPETQAFLDYLSGVGNQVNAPTQVFAQLADWSLANKLQAEGMFADESPLPTRADLMMEFQDLTGVPVDPSVLDMIKARVTRTQAREKISNTIREKLTAAGQETEQVEAQARIWTNAVMRLAELAHRDPLEILPNIDLEGVPSAADGFTMPVTQGRNWQYGDHAAQNPDYRVKVTRLNEPEQKNIPDNKEIGSALGDYVGQSPKVQLQNNVTGWVFTVSGSDKNEIVHGVSRLSQGLSKAEEAQSRKDNLSILKNLSEIVKNAFLAESYRDIKVKQGASGKDNQLKGMHRFYAPVSVDGREYLVKITVKDRIGDGGKGSGINQNDRLGAYQIVGIETEKAQHLVEPPIPSDIGEASPDGIRRPTVEVMNTPRYTEDKVTVRDMLTGVKRDGDVVYKKETGADGKESWVKDEGKRSRFFVDEPNEWAYAEDGGYWRDPADPASDMEFNQIIGETGVRGMDAWDENWTRTNLLTVAKQMEMGGKTPEEIRAATGWERGADREWRYEIPDLTVKDGAAALVAEKRAAAQKDGKKLFSVALDDLVDAPDLFKAFGRLRDLKIEFGELPPMAGGYFSPAEDAIRIPFNTDITTDGARMTMIHEIQHAIQEIEGFTKGADFSRVPTKGKVLWRAMSELRRLRDNPDWQEYKDVSDAIDRIYDDDATKARREKGITQEEDDAEADRLYARQIELEKLPAVQAVLAEEKRLMKIYGSSEFDGAVLEAIKKASESPDDPLFENVSRWNPQFQTDAYRRVGGEVEARNAGWRAFMSPEDRAKKLLRDTEDVPRSEQTRNGEFYQVAYHGSPYLFDKFSLDHVGEGVRAQWYGWGMYFSLDKNVARQYASNLYNASKDTRDRYNRLAAEADRLQHELTAAEDSGDAAAADGLRAQLTEAKAALDKALPDHPRVYDAEIPEDSVMVRAGATIDQQPEAVQQAFRNLLGDVDGSKNGRALYNELAKKLGSKRAASEALRNEGVLGLRYANSMDGECAVVWDDKAIEIREFLQEAKENGEIRGSYNPQTNTLRLTPNADITTFSHEMGHFWLTNAIRLSTLPGSDLSLRRDVRKLMDTWGIKDASEWEKLGTEGQRQYHEQFASWVEEFLATGRVPNDGLRGLFEKMRQWITDLYRDIRSHLNSRYRQEFGKDLPALSDEVRDILERNIAYEDRLAAVQRDFSPTTAQTDAARYATFENVVKNDQLVDRSDAQSLQGSLFAEQQAKDALNNREKVNVNGPMDADMLQGRQDAVKKSLHMPESLEARPKDEGMPVHEIPKAEPKPEAQEEGGIAAVVRRVSDALLGKQPEENAAPKEDTDVADIMRRSDEVLERSPDMQLTPDEVSDANDLKPGKTAAEYVAAVDAEAQSIEKFANVMSTAAMCVLRNGGITHA